MPTWQILPAADGDLRWVAAAASGDPCPPPEAPPRPPETLVSGDDNHPIPNHRLPSMADLLLQARPKLLEVGAEQSGAGAPLMFRTGTGRSVSLSESSIRKARAVLEGEGSEMRGGEGLGDGSGRFPMFRTGSGKSVTVKRSSIRKAASVLGGENEENDVGTILERGGGSGDFPMFQTGSGKPVTVKQDSFRKAVAILEGEDMKKEGDLGCGGFPIFQTGSGKLVSVKQDSFRKAVAVLEGADMKKDYEESLEGAGGSHISMFHNGQVKVLNVARSSVQKATAVLAKEDVEKDTPILEGRWGNDDFPMFRSGKGKPVNVSRSSITKAAAILEGVDTEKASLDNLQGCEDNGDASVFHIGLRSSISLKHSLAKKAMSVLQYKDNMEKDELHKYNINGQLFQTSSVEAVNVSSAGLSRATALLGLERNDLASAQSFGHSEDQLGNLVLGDACQIPQGSEVPTFGAKSLEGLRARPPIMFQTARGRSVSISSDALQRARSLLGDSDLGVLQNDIKASHPLTFDPKDEKSFDGISRNKENITFDPFQDIPASKNVLTNLSYFLPVHDADQLNANGTLLKSRNWPSCKTIPMLNPQHKGLYTNNVISTVKMTQQSRIPSGPLVEISNLIGVDNGNMDRFTTEKRRLGRRNSISPFKRPRTSRFMTPLNSSSSFFSTGSSELSTIHEGCRQTRLSTRYPFHQNRKNMKEFFGGPPHNNPMCDIPDEVKHINADNAAKFEFHGASSCAGIGSEAFQHMLLQSGGSLSSATKEWVANHYKYIVWKLACLERCYPAVAGGKYLTVSNVLEELKYRYEREVNYGHRSTIKKILEGDASPASAMILCVSAIRSHSDHAAKVELTDGWYPLDAVLDVSLSKQLQAGKLFVGQKLRVLWAFFMYNSKGPGPPLAFRCIKSYGGIVPMTLVGVTRVYPLLYKERFPNGGSVVRSERMERKALQLCQQRRSKIVEDIMSEQQEHFENINDSDEGAKICKILESAAEPEVIMAEMSSEQLVSFSPFFCPRKAVLLSNLGEVPLASEFDVAAVIVHVGEVYLSESQKKQWIFMTDGSGSTSEIQFEEMYNRLLAVSFCSPTTDNDSSAIFTNTLSGTTVGLCNLIKRPRDQINHFWVAEATENSTCSISYNLPSSSHLKEAAVSAEKWAKMSYSTIQKMRKRVLCVVGGRAS
uniref:Tower domain-containing protein n=1 Tax=Ananas comosus var. bracteatus TaxID=296719 RepID=A0A6V7QA62_ANACO|nr:unnamed protein product [Ananas comosus var. bracteatus]